MGDAAEPQMDTRSGPARLRHPCRKEDERSRSATTSVTTNLCCIEADRRGQVTSKSKQVATACVLPCILHRTTSYAGVTIQSSSCKFQGRPGTVTAAATRCSCIRLLLRFVASSCGRTKAAAECRSSLRGRPLGCIHPGRIVNSYRGASDFFSISLEFMRARVLFGRQKRRSFCPLAMCAYLFANCTQFHILSMCHDTNPQTRRL